MKLFLIGLSCALVGFVIWFPLCFFYGISEGLKGKLANPVILAGPFSLMVGGPFICWIILPLVRLFRRRGKK